MHTFPDADGKCLFDQSIQNLHYKSRFVFTDFDRSGSQGGLQIRSVECLSNIVTQLGKRITIAYAHMLSFQLGIK